MIGRGKTADTSLRGLRAVELVEPGSTVADEGRLAKAWLGEFAVHYCQFR